MILYKGKAKDYSLDGIKKSLAKKTGVIVHKNILLKDLIQYEGEILFKNHFKWLKGIPQYNMNQSSLSRHLRWNVSHVENSLPTLVHITSNHTIL